MLSIRWISVEHGVEQCLFLFKTEFADTSSVLGHDHLAKRIVSATLA